MARTTYYVQDCPTCGRRLQVRVEYLGRSVRCQHCGAGFEASDPSVPDTARSRADAALIARVDQLLASADELWHLGD